MQLRRPANKSAQPQRPHQFKECVHCKKRVAPNQLPLHQTKCRIEQIEMQQRREQKQQRDAHHYHQPRRPVQYEPEDSFDSSSSSDADNQFQQEVFPQMPDFNQIFGPNTIFHRQMNNMMRQLHTGLNIGVNINNHHFQFQMSGPQNFGIQIVSSGGFYSDEEEEEEEEQPRQKPGLTRSQLNNYRTCKYTGKEGKNCVVCMADYKKGDTLKTLRCMHQFHSKCIDEWLKRKPECPICRHEA